VDTDADVEVVDGDPDECSEGIEGITAGEESKVSCTAGEEADIPMSNSVLRGEAKGEGREKL
jgi:hypothetical protein